MRDEVVAKSIPGNGAAGNMGWICLPVLAYLLTYLFGAGVRTCVPCLLGWARSGKERSGRFLGFEAVKGVKRTSNDFVRLMNRCGRDCSGIGGNVICDTTNCDL